MVDIDTYVMPCPFCGEKPLRTDRDGIWRHWNTNKCVLDGMYFRDRKAWNTRIISYRPNNPRRGTRANIDVIDDHISDISEEILTEMIKPFRED